MISIFTIYTYFFYFLHTITIVLIITFYLTKVNEITENHFIMTFFHAFENFFKYNVIIILRKGKSEFTNIIIEGEVH